MLIGLNIVLCNGGGWEAPGGPGWSPWRPGLVKFLNTFVDFRHVAHRRRPWGGPGRARSVAEGRERDDFWTQESVREQLFTLFCIFKGKVRKLATKKGGGPMMDFFTLGPTGVHVL